MNICPKISIVTPSFNQGKYIEETIVSVLDQQYPNLEYIIIDGGSTDDTVSIIRKYEKYISFWQSKTDRGQTDAIKLGVARLICKLEKDSRSTLKPYGFLTRDARIKERKKYGLRKARKAPQYSKR